MLKFMILLYSNEEVLKRVKQDLPIQLIQQRQLHFLGHILRKPGNELVNRYALFHPKHGKRKVITRSPKATLPA